eukprot:GHUV01038587.1.p2 GENE.GHUV01038587.1~~GHUV01038587.1.p2  ORF type:complete len:116 (-),score=6.44 GHUV01038587.1:204-551(-)
MAAAGRQTAYRHWRCVHTMLSCPHLDVIHASPVHLYSGLRMNKAHVTHPELKATFNLDILGVKKNPNGAMYSSLGVITKGTIIEVNVSELGLVTPGGKVVWGKYAQVSTVRATSL